MKYGIIETKTESKWVPGDERSRTHPGHGYPEGYETTTTIIFREYDTEEKLKQRLKWLGPDKLKGLRVITFEDVKVETEVVIKVGGNL